MKARILSILGAASVMLFTGFATAQVGSDISESSLQELIQNADPIAGMVRLPITGMQAVENSDGEIIFVSDSGRFAIVGELVDVWQVKTLNSLAQIRTAIERIDLRGDGVDVDALNVVSLGNGPQEVIVFTDPLCTICSKVMSDAELLTKEFTFKFIVIPALGDDSNKLARQFYCAADKDERYQALKNNSISSLKVKPDCDIAMYDQTLLVSHLLSVDGVPFILSPKGRIHRGRPASLAGWLNEDTQGQ